ncbi:UNKNOWN [Stylonychia lemnae]|uniref:Uncharacterized protein n=1 Tax=Stylonychia lemnae TaxID=5949 RepID=A0A078AXM4_STYLE|nr:UNKNOWN [Stylonychia lemnae]|eukprot:CDW87215.1 UNKNOWN [Stylonychia lemnae]
MRISTKTLGLTLFLILITAEVIAHYKQSLYVSGSDDLSLISVEQTKQPSNKDISNTATKAKEAMKAYQNSKLVKNIQGCIQAISTLSEYMGVAGSVVGFVFTLFGGSSYTPDPALLELEDMIRDTQLLIIEGNEEVMNSIRKLNSQQAIRNVQDALSILDTLEEKHLIQKLDFEHGAYDVSPCGNSMTLCNNAFIKLAKSLDDVLEASFEESPKGEKNRVFNLADNLMQRLMNSFYSITWLNAQQYKSSHPTEQISNDDTQKISEITQSITLQHYLKDHAIASYQKWLVEKKFSSCRLCSSCSNDYPLYQGSGEKEDDWGHWLRFRDHCEGDLYNEDGPPNLCCSINEPPVRYCESCGGDYPYRIGRRLNIDDWGPYHMTGHGCQGNFYKTNREFEVCGRNRKQCKMCAGQCQANYTLVGQVLRQGDWGFWKVYDTPQCNPGYDGDINVDKSADVSFCCLDETI